MPIGKAIDDAVCAQLEHDGYQRPQTYLEIMNKDYGYNELKIQGYLHAVSDRMLPAFNFRWQEMNFADSAAAPVGVLEGMIRVHTDPAAQPAQASKNSHKAQRT